MGADFLLSVHPPLCKSCKTLSSIIQQNNSLGNLFTLVNGSLTRNERNKPRLHQRCFAFILDLLQTEKGCAVEMGKRAAIKSPGKFSNKKGKK